jgi:hypothetical protein
MPTPSAYFVFQAIRIDLVKKLGILRRLTVLGFFPKALHHAQITGWADYSYILGASVVGLLIR